MAVKKKIEPAGKKAASPPAVKKKRTGAKTSGVETSAQKPKKIEKKKPAASGKPAGKPAVKKKTAAPAAAKDNRLWELKKTLIQRRETIVREAKEEIAKYVSGENRQLVDTALDEGDLAVIDISEDLNLRRLAAHRKTLHDIDEALRKIKEGTYGICEECGEEISEKRLRVLPTATLCITCQENKERLEAIEKEEI